MAAAGKKTTGNRPLPVTWKESPAAVPLLVQPTIRGRALPGDDMKNHRPEPHHSHEDDRVWRTRQRDDGACLRAPTKNLC